jgi:hypothetical protein
VSSAISAALFRPEIGLLGETTRVLVELAGRSTHDGLVNSWAGVSPEQQWGIDEALVTVLGLR